MEENKINKQKESDVSLTTSTQGADTPSNVSNTTAATIPQWKNAISSQVATFRKDTGRNEPGTRTENDNSFTRKSNGQRTLSESLVKLTAHRDVNQNQKSAPLIATQTTTPQQNTTTNNREGTGDLLSRCLEIIGKMKAATGRQRNISKDVKFGLVELEDAIEAIAHDLNIQAQREQQPLKTIQPLREQHDKTGTSNGMGSSTKMIAISPFEEDGEKSLSGELPEETHIIESIDDRWQKKESRREKHQRKMVENELRNRQDNNENSNGIPTAGNQNPNKRRVGIRDALLIKPRKGQSYAEVLKEIRSKVNPDESEAEIRSIRKTRAGEVLLQLGSRTKNKDGFREVLSTTLGDNANVVCLETKTTVEIRDLDCFTENAEVEEALKKIVPVAEVTQIKVFPTSSDQKIAVVVMNSRAAWKLLEQGKIKIGWTYCRVRKRAIATRCFKCFGYGHVARNCSGPDRSKLCYICLRENHKAKDCNAQSSCVLCREKGVNETDLAHVMGSRKCKVFRDALQVAKNLL